ncbi:cysteine synthase A [Nitzschia inconspicua]|uniref:Cysteine synthase A n=1 Tax=Nitzschia inconspicua TaxID=303405 RepID=A0A9K3LAG5_9STRA|nr:cysteine synthase A [Nitzschia inconspicua]
MVTLSLPKRLTITTTTTTTTSTTLSTTLLLGTGASLVTAVTVLLVTRWWWTNLNDQKEDEISSSSLSAHEQLIAAGTPLIKLRRVSQLVQRSIYVKMESLNPGGTGKDRAAWNMIRTAEQQGRLPLPQIGTVIVDNHDLVLYPSLKQRRQQPKQQRYNASSDEDGSTTMETKLDAMIIQAMERSRTGGIVVEGTSGSTGIALATLCACRGHACLVILPDDQAVEKQTILRSLGAVVMQVPTASISNPYHYVNLARKASNLARDKYNVPAVFMDQFENEANFDMHYRTTGPELWRQLAGEIDAFVMSSGTGGTIAGVATFLKQVQPNIRIVLVDPPGSSLYHKVEHGVAYAPQQQERTLRKHRYDTIAEGIGLDRITHNFQLGLDGIDAAIRVSDQEAVDMAHWILTTEGLWIGSSSAMNLVGAIRTALEMPVGSQVITMICDGGQRHATRFWDPTFIEKWGLQWPQQGCIPECIQSIV